MSQPIPPGTPDLSDVPALVEQANLGPAPVAVDLGTNTDRYVNRWTQKGYPERGQVFGGMSGLWNLTMSVRNTASRMTAETVTRVRDDVVLYDLAAGVDLLPVCPWCGPICERQLSHLSEVTGR